MAGRTVTYLLDPVDLNQPLVVMQRNSRSMDDNIYIYIYVCVCVCVCVICKHSLKINEPEIICLHINSSKYCYVIPILFVFTSINNPFNITHPFVRS